MAIGCWAGIPHLLNRGSIELRLRPGSLAGCVLQVLPAGPRGRLSRRCRSLLASCRELRPVRLPLLRPPCDRRERLGRRSVSLRTASAMPRAASEGHLYRSAIQTGRSRIYLLSKPSRPELPACLPVATRALSDRSRLGDWSGPRSRLRHRHQLGQQLQLGEERRHPALVEQSRPGHAAISAQ